MSWCTLQKPPSDKNTARTCCSYHNHYFCYYYYYYCKMIVDFFLYARSLITPRRLSVMPLPLSVSLFLSWTFWTDCRQVTALLSRPGLDNLIPIPCDLLKLTWRKITFFYYKTLPSGICSQSISHPNPGGNEILFFLSKPSCSRVVCWWEHAGG